MIHSPLAGEKETTLIDIFAPEKNPFAPIPYKTKPNEYQVKLSNTNLFLHENTPEKKNRGTMLSYIQDKLVNHLLTFHIFYKVILLKTLTII